MPSPSNAALESYRRRGFDCLCGNMRMAARAVTALYDGHLAAAGLTAAELSVLWCVIAAQPVSMQRIAEFLAMEKSTVTRNVDADKVCRTASCATIILYKRWARRCRRSAPATPRGPSSSAAKGGAA